MNIEIVQILNTLPDFIRIIDGSLRIVWINAKYEEFLAKDRNDIIGKNSLDVIATGFKCQDEEVFLKKVLEEKQVESRDISVKGKDTTHYYQILYTPYTDKSGEAGIVEHFRNISELIHTRIALEEQLLKSRGVLGKTVNSLVRAFETRDPYTAGHQQRVSQLCRQIAQTMRPQDRKWIEGLRVAAQLHDIGKICVPAEILANPRKLKNEEFELIKMHAETGYAILKDIDFHFDFSVEGAILQHHERLDGMGYPGGLSGESVMLEARILAVADVVEAMAYHRPYRAAIGIEAALDEIRSCAGVKYDRDVVDICCSLFLNNKFQFNHFKS